MRKDNPKERDSVKIRRKKEGNKKGKSDRKKNKQMSRGYLWVRKGEANWFPSFTSCSVTLEDYMTDLMEKKQIKVAILAFYYL